MTLPASAVPLSERLPSTQERDSANQLRSVLASASTHEPQRLTLAIERGNTVDMVLMPELSQLLMDVLRHVGQGDAVTVVPLGQMLTTQQAADILNVSRPFLIGLLERREIDHVLVGRHRRVKAADLFDYKRKRDAQRAEALGALAALDADDF